LYFYAAYVHKIQLGFHKQTKDLFGVFFIAAFFEFVDVFEFNVLSSRVRLEEQVFCFRIFNFCIKLSVFFLNGCDLEADIFLLQLSKLSRLVLYFSSVKLRLSCKSLMSFLALSWKSSKVLVLVSKFSRVA